MSDKLLCSWFGLETNDWPPDHYRLLGLKPGESDAKLIEQRIHQRLDAVRGYQVCHPEQATEAMNRLAQAFVCLTEPAAKKRYDSALIGSHTPVPRRPKPQTMHAIPAPINGNSKIQMPFEEVVLPLPESQPDKVSPILEAARSPVARCCLGTRRALLRRIRLTRKFVDVWTRTGKFLAVSKRRTILKESDAAELASLFNSIARLRRRYPRILGEAGQPGYLVVFLARHDAVPEFAKLERGQRDALYRDWQAGLDLLRAHLDFLREEAAELRLMTPGQRFRRAMHSTFVDQPGTLAFLVVLLATNIVLWRWTWTCLRHP